MSNSANAGMGGIDPSLHIAFGELHYHMKQTREECEELRRQNQELLQLLDNRSSSSTKLQQDVSRLAKENSVLAEQVNQLVKENENLKKNVEATSNSKRTVNGNTTTNGFKYPIQISPSATVESLSVDMLQQMRSEMCGLAEWGERICQMSQQQSAIPTDDQRKFLEQLQKQTSALRHYLSAQRLTLQRQLAAKQRNTSGARSMRPESSPAAVASRSQRS